MGLSEDALLQASAHCFLHKRDDPGLFSGGQLLEREDDRPQGAFVEVRRVLEAQRRVPRVELLRGLVEADNLAVLRHIHAPNGTNHAKYLHPPGEILTFVRSVKQPPQVHDYQMPSNHLEETRCSQIQHARVHLMSVQQ
jgi:hypothetical protein